MRNSDHSHFIEFIRQLPQQIITASSILNGISFRNISQNFNAIVFTGMGGSAITGELLSAYLLDELKIPLFVNRNYTLPNFVSESSLVIACSYSGNTEETISAVREALEKKATVIAIATGGQLREIAEENGIVFIKIPEGNPPRQALGYMFFAALHLLIRMGLVESKNDDINETVHVLENLNNRNDHRNSQGHNLPNHIAQKLYNKIPIIYTAAQHLNPVTVRWRNQFNENSKTFAFSNVFPELNHNEIMGKESPEDLLKNLCIVLLRDEDELPRNRVRLEVTRDLMRKAGIPIFEIFSEGESRLARMFSHICIGDWVSFYLAMHYGKDPIKIESIQNLKDVLSETIE